jgi:hypothetical protein
MDGLMKALVCSAGVLVVAMPASAQIQAAKKKEGEFPGKWYGTLEMRHHVNTYVDEVTQDATQQPSVHARAQVGAQFYEGMLDAYATLGVYKQPETQQIVQRRTELAVDFYPFKNEYFTILQYNLAQLPTRGADVDPENPDEQPKVGTIYTAGLAPSARYPTMFGAEKFEFKAGLDGWTRMYSQKQYTEEYSYVGEDESRLALAQEDPETIEDTALHYRSQAMAGVGYSPSFWRAASLESTVNYHSRFTPRYELTDTGVDHTYGVERYSYYRVRLSVDLTERVSFVNDFYQFHDEMFGDKRTGEDRRYRNIARVTCKL